MAELLRFIDLDDESKSIVLDALSRGVESVELFHEAMFHVEENGRRIELAKKALSLGPTTESSFPNYWLGGPKKPSPLAETQKMPEPWKDSGI